MTYRPTLPPMKHQVTAGKRLNSAPRKGFALLMEMGTGKSKVLLDEWGEAATGGGPQTLIVCAPAGVYLNWHDPDNPKNPETEINKHLDPELRARTLVAVWRSGSSRSKKEIEYFLTRTDRPRILVVNVEAFSTVDKLADVCEELMLQGPTIFDVDESTTIKGYSSSRSKRVRQLGEFAALRRIATGLVTPRSPMDLFAQFYFLDHRILGFQSYYGFRARYAVMKPMEHQGRKFKQIVGYRNVDELQEKIAPHSYRVLKKDCLDLPPKTYVQRTVKLSDAQRKAYDEVRDFAVTALDAETFVSATSVITQIIRLHQILCGHVVDENGGAHDLPCPRMELDLLDVLSEAEGKVIVWTPYARTIQKMHDLLEREFGRGCTARFWGGNRDVRQAEEARWRGDPACRFMIATQSAGGFGRTWVEASTSVYYANGYNLEHRSQSEDRNHRRGTTGPVTYVDLVAPGTVDEKILKSLRKKIDMATAISGENYREWLM